MSRLWLVSVSWNFLATGTYCSYNHKKVKTLIPLQRGVRNNGNGGVNNSRDCRKEQMLVSHSKSLTSASYILSSLWIQERKRKKLTWKPLSTTNPRKKWKPLSGEPAVLLNELQYILHFSGIDNIDTSHTFTLHPHIMPAHLSKRVKFYSQYNSV